MTVNGRTVARTREASTRTLTETSAAGRVTTTVLDTEGRPVQQQVGTLTPTQFSYDPDGRLDGVARGSRVTTMTYDSDSFVDSVTDAANRTVSSEYDDAGRVTEQELPDLRVIGFEYDTYAYDGSLPLGETWSGTVAGSVSRVYDTSFRVTEQKVNGGGVGTGSDHCKMRKDQDFTPRDHALQRFIDAFFGAGWSL